MRKRRQAHADRVQHATWTLGGLQKELHSASFHSRSSLVQLMYLSVLVNYQSR